MEPIPVEGDGEPFVLAGHVVGTDRKVLPVSRRGGRGEDEGVGAAHGYTGPFAVEAADATHERIHTRQRRGDKRDFAGLVPFDGNEQDGGDMPADIRRT
jgi:hypothetical protein